MGYRIRYGVETRRFSWARIQLVGALVLLAGIALAELLGGGEVLRAVLLPGTTVLETATTELSKAVSGGEGWYVSLARFCGRIIHGAV